VVLYPGTAIISFRPYGMPCNGPETKIIFLTERCFEHNSDHALNKVLRFEYLIIFTQKT
jgi:hypothetical protein